MSNRYAVRANGGSGFFRPNSGDHTIKFTLGLWNSAAFKTLSFSARLILLDWIRHYQEISHWESIDLTGVGFEYAYAVCHVEGVSENTFLKARKEIIAHGFFTVPPELQPHIPCMPIRFMPDNKWRRYQPTAKEQAAIERCEAARAKRAEHGKAGKGVVVEFLKAAKKQKTTSKNVGDIPTKNVGMLSG